MNGGSESRVCVCVCARVREKREIGRERELPNLFLEVKCPIGGRGVESKSSL